MILKRRYNDIVRQVYESALREVGYRRRGANCHRFVSPNIVHLVNFQKSVYSNSHKISFTVNLGVYRVGVQTVLMPEAPEPSRPSISDCIIQKRLGFLLPTGLDEWWDIIDADDLYTDNSIISEISAALRDYGLPFLAALDNDEAILRYVLKELFPRYPILETIRAAALACVLRCSDTTSHLLGIALEKAEKLGNDWVGRVQAIMNRCL